jgi:toxin CcdB
LRQFDVLPNPNVASRRYAPFVAVLQSHHLDPIDTVVLAPLVNDAERPVSSLEISVNLSGEPLVLVIAELAGVRREGLGKPVGSLRPWEDEIRRAFERLLTGF